MRENGLINYAVTDTSICMFWEKPEGVSAEAVYRIYIDGKPAGTTNRTHFILDGLKAASEYAVELLMAGEKEDPLQMDQCVIKTAEKKMRLDVTLPPYCATGDGRTLNTAAIQRALDDCTQESMVYIPKGVFMTGALNVHSNTELYLEEGAVLQGTDCPQDYLPRIWSRFEGTEMECYSSLMNLGKLNHGSGPNCENVLIHGKGIIASGGRSLAEAVIASEKERLKEFLNGLGNKIGEYEKPETIPGRVRPRLINMSNCKNVRISGLTLANGASWNVHMIYSEDILTDHCIFRSEHVWNGDGWDPDSSENCTIFACTFYTGDDSIAIKSGKNPEGNVIGRPSEQIRIFDCTCMSGHGITIGSEMSGGVDDVKIWDCNLQNGVYGLEIKGTKKRGGYVRNIHVTNCVLPRILFHSVAYNDDGIGAPTPPVFEKCSFTDVTVLGRFRNCEGEIQPCTAIELSGFDVPGYEIRDILFKRISLPERAEERQNISLRFCKNISFDDYSLTETVRNGGAYVQRSAGG